VGLGWRLIYPLNVKLLYSYLFLYYNLIKIDIQVKTGGGSGGKRMKSRKYPPKKVPPIGGRF